MRVIVSGNIGWLFLNERFVTALTLGVSNAGGDIEVTAAFFECGEIPGAVTSVEASTVWAP